MKRFGLRSTAHSTHSSHLLTRHGLSALAFGCTETAIPVTES